MVTETCIIRFEFYLLISAIFGPSICANVVSSSLSSFSFRQQIDARDYEIPNFEMEGKLRELSTIPYTSKEY